MARRGAFIVFEGLDRSGKSTQSKLLANRLADQGTKVHQIAFPDRNEVFGQIIDAFLKRQVDIDSREALHLAFSVNRWQKAGEIKKKLEEGYDIICDRYCYSGVSYSIAQGLDETWVKQADIGLPQPDLVLFFKVDPSVAAARGGYGEERLEGQELQRKVAVEMTKLQQPYWTVVDANVDVDSVAAQVDAAVSQINRDVPLEKIKQL